MLPIHEHILGELLQEEDGAVVVLGAGLGLHKIVASLIALHTTSATSSSSSTPGSEGVLLLLSASDQQRASITEEILERNPDSPLPLNINNEYNAADRLAFYSKGGGGAAFITPRILIVDLLNGRLPGHLMSGLVFLNAHRLSESCTEAFIARLFRKSNRKGLIRAFTDRPHAMVGGFSKAERIMRSLFIRKLHLWPRFHMSISSALEQHQPTVIDLRIPLTPAMQGMNSAILEVMDACLKELRKTNKIDVEDLTLENGLFKSFDEIIRRQLDPIWHTLGRKTKQLVSDLKTLRKLAVYLVRYDAITFLKYLDTLRASEDVRSIWIYANPSHKIFEFAKKRVFQVVRTSDGLPVVDSNKNRGKSKANGQVVDDEGGNDSKRRKLDGGSGKESVAADGISEGKEANSTVKQGVEVVVMAEEMPKWKALNEVLQEIRGEFELMMKSSIGEASVDSEPWDECVGTILIACKDERTCLQLQDCINKGPQKLMNDEWEKYLLGKAELHGMKTRKKRAPSGVKGIGVLNGGKNLRKEAENSSTREEEALLAAATELTVSRNDGRGGRNRRGGGRAHGRGRRGSLSGRGRSQKIDISAYGIVSKSAKESFTIDTDNSALSSVSTSIKESSASESVTIDAGDSAFSCANKFVKDTSTWASVASTSTTSSITNTSAADATATTSPPNTSTISAVAASATAATTTTNTTGDALEEGNTMDVERIEEDRNAGRPSPPVHFYALESEQRILHILKPSFVVLYDPDMAFVREIEVYKAENPVKFLKVYFLFYDNSVETQKYEASIQRENSAFESLIRQKASMMIPMDQDGRLLDASASTPSPNHNTNSITRKAGGRKCPEKQMQIVVDMREFGSSLPCVLHQQGMMILPVTLEVGDYILSPDICVERKSIMDLFASFSSGRLYHQAETMSRYYKIPVLLIEFSQDKSFSFQSANDVGEDIVPTNIISKLSILVLHFPRLRIVWSRSLHATADIFLTLKSNQDEPDLDKAMRIGVPTEDGLIEGDVRAENYNSAAVELLRRLPGVTDANYRSLMEGCESLAELACLPLEKLSDLMGGQRPARMLRDFLDAKYPTL